MIVSVTVINSYGEKIKMVLDDPEDSGYAITSISGIEPVQVDIKQTQLVSGLKYKYNFGFYKNRDIGFNIIYSEWGPDGLKSIEKRRDNLYKYFKTNDKIQIIFERGRRDGSSGTQLFYIEGYVYKHAPTFFSQQCGAVINVTCPDPWFRECWWTDQTETELSFTTVVQSSGPSLTVNYEGDIFTGFKLTMDNDLTAYAGETISLNTMHNSIERTLLINIPTRYDVISKLDIDMSSDVLNIYSMEPSEFSDEYYVATIKETTLDNVSILEEGDIVFLDGSSHSSQCIVDSDESIVLTSINGIDKIEKLSLYKYYLSDERCNPRFTTTITNNAPDYSAGHGFRLYLEKYDDGYIVLDSEWRDTDTTLIHYTEDAYGYPNIGFIFCKKPIGYSMKNRNGWIDATSISKRQEIPALYPGQNVVELDSEIQNTTFKIEYNTLYRGL